jgi:hypothetical protein
MSLWTVAFRLDTSVSERHVANSGELLYTQCFFQHCISDIIPSRGGLVYNRFAMSRRFDRSVIFLNQARRERMIIMALYRFFIGCQNTKTTLHEAI